MQASETDFEYANPKEVSEAEVNGIAGGIMDLIDIQDPNHSGEAISRPPEEEKEPVKPEPEEETDEEPEKYTIKWQGQDKEVTQAELFDLAQKGFDYTSKTQALASERDQLSPYVGLANILKSDPLKAQQIAAIISGQAQPPPQAQKQFDDPIEQLKWETKQEALAEIRQELANQLTPLHRQQVLNQVRQQVQSDPDYKEVHASIIEMVKSQPPAIQKAMYLQLDQDPASYVEAFQFYKERLQKPATTPLPKPIKTTSRAPILESGGVDTTEGVEGRAKADRVSKQKAKAFRSSDPMEIAKWIEQSGAIDHLY
jgi:hypothetical protein